MPESNDICVWGARVNNLKNIDVEIPKNKIVVVDLISNTKQNVS